MKKKWIRVCAQLGTAQRAFDSQNVVESSVAATWKQLAQDADAMRGSVEDAMDIYDVPVTMRKLPVSSHPDVSRTYANIGRSSPDPETDRNISNRDKFKISGAQARRPGLGSRWLST